MNRNKQQHTEAEEEKQSQNREVVCTRGHVFRSKSLIPERALPLERLHAHMLSHFSRVRLCNPMDCSPPGSSVHRILQARILEWVSMPFSKESPNPRIKLISLYVSCIDKWVLYHWHRLGSSESPEKWEDSRSYSKAHVTLLLKLKGFKRILRNRRGMSPLVIHVRPRIG